MLIQIRLAAVLLAFAVGASACTSCERVCDINSNGDFFWASDCDLVVVNETEMTTLDGAEGMGAVLSIDVADNPQLTDVSALGEVATAGLNVTRNDALDVVALERASGSVSIIDNGATDIELGVHAAEVAVDVDVASNHLALFVREPEIERVSIDAAGDLPSSALRVALHFADAIPAEANWDATAIGLVSLEVSGVADATATTLAPLAVPSEFFGVYGSGAMQPFTDGVDEFESALRAAGFAGTLEVCVDRCHSGRERCDDDRQQLPCDVR